jgi:hypothetical protein
MMEDAMKRYRKGLFPWPTRSGLACLILLCLWLGRLTAAADQPIYLPLVLSGGPTQPAPGDCLTAEEMKLADLINNYRRDHGLAAVPLSRSLTAVAQWHVLDLSQNSPDTNQTDPRGIACNLHSWSDKGHWTPVCYTADHAYAARMWRKPREITGNVYWGDGFESAYGSFGRATATGAFAAWQNSPPHNALLLETGDWQGARWPAMGVGIYEHHAVLWFGNQVDPQGTVGQCPATR